MSRARARQSGRAAPTADALDAGVLRCLPNFQSRFYRDGGRFPGANRGDGVADARGNYVDERWLFSTTRIEQEGAGLDGGLSLVADARGRQLGTLDALVSSRPDEALGGRYLSSRGGRASFDLLAKVLDIGTAQGDRINCHLHPRKDEAYYYPPAPGQEDRFLAMGFFPGTRESVRRCLEGALAGERDDGILSLMPHFRLEVGTGWHVYSGMPHSPVGYVFELQRPLDDFRLLQLFHRAQGRLFGPELMLRSDAGVEAVMADVDWAMAESPHIRELFRTEPRPIPSTGGVEERWVFPPERTHLWSGKEVALEEGARHVLRERGPFGLLAFQGEGEVGGVAVAAGDPRRDELFATGPAAEAGVELEASRAAPLVVYAFFPEGVNRAERLVYETPRFRELMAASAIEPRGY